MNKSDKNRLDDNAIYVGRLLKSALMVFPEGSYLISNVYGSDGEPAIEGRIPSLEKREATWKKIKGCRADGRLCRVFSTYEDFFAYKGKLERTLRRAEFLNAMRESRVNFPRPIPFSSN